jgi:hypothetical protein
MLHTIHTNSAILKYLNRSHTSSFKSRVLIRNAFIWPYFQLIYTIWPLLSNSLIERIEASNRQILRLLYNWWDARNTDLKWLPLYQTVATRAQKFLRRFLDKVSIVYPELFDSYILAKVIPLYLRMHLYETRFITALPHGRSNKNIKHWINSNTTSTYQCSLDYINHFLSQ